MLGSGKETGMPDLNVTAESGTVSSEKGVAERFSKIIENLERITDLSSRRVLRHNNFSFDDIADTRRPTFGNAISLEYFRLVRLMAWSEIFGAEAPKLSYLAGEKIGRKLNIDSVDGLASRLELMGLARVVVINSSDTGGKRNRIVIRFKESAVSFGIAFLGEPICHFEAGLLAGILEKIHKRKITVTETKCVAMGHEYCQFESDLSEKQRASKVISENALSLDYSEENIQLLSTLAAHTVAALENATRYEHTKKMVITDTLTKTYNYGYFQSRLKEEIQRAERQGQIFSLVMVDLDGFKQLNDRFGHPSGDRILKETAHIIKESIRGIDILCRYGGDEFALILPQTDKQETIKVLERMRTEIEEHNFTTAVKEEVGELKLTASFGCAMYPQDSTYSEQLIEQADQALYDAKKSGRNQLCLFCEKS